MVPSDNVWDMTRSHTWKALAPRPTKRDRPCCSSRGRSTDRRASTHPGSSEPASSCPPHRSVSTVEEYDPQRTVGALEARCRRTQPRCHWRGEQQIYVIAAASAPLCRVSSPTDVVEEYDPPPISGARSARACPSREAPSPGRSRRAHSTSRARGPGSSVHGSLPRARGLRAGHDRWLSLPSMPIRGHGCWRRLGNRFTS